MTTVYQSYLTAINEGTIDLNDVNFSCHAVGEYVPDENHTLADLVGNEETAGLVDIKCTVDSVLTGNCNLTDSMAQLIDKIKEKVGEVEGVKMYVLFQGETLCFAEEIG